ncbi:MAG TPA: GTP-binding protein [Candidatus Mediterraneibacter merdipullorum]|nr:GTP-binding protein [Candidatus Mediterraneibacter merdipullorum]
MTKIDIISGFLGAGKTTLIKKLLSDAFRGEQVVLIENEFGEIGIDGGFLKESGIEIREMNSGCICCSLVGDFGKSLREVVDTYHPDRILIEPSGVGKLSDVIKAVQDVQADIDAELNSFTTVVDVTKCRIYRKNFGEFFSNQIEYAGAVILSRTDKAKPEKIEEGIALLRELNDKAPFITTPIAQLPGAKILETMESGKSLEDELLDELVCPECGHHHAEGECCGHDHEHEHHHDHGEHEHHHDHGEHEHHHDHGEHGHDHHHDHDGCSCGHDHHHHDHAGHHHADEVFTSWGRETIHTYTKEQISGILKTLESDESYGNILRAKGMVAGKDGEWIYFDMVPGEHEVRHGAPEYTGRICVIGAEINEDGLAKLFGLA